jgi:DNA excision repair protein ERCC-3
MSYIPDKALIVQSDRTILLEVHSPKAEAARKAIAGPHEKLPDLE